MEYNFKTNETSPERCVILKHDVLIYIANGAIYDIPYRRITSVWLNKPSGILSPNCYSCTLNIEDDKPIYISSKNWDDYKNEITQQNHYNSFVRVLHIHLKEKSRAKYGFGVKPMNYLLKMTGIMGIVAIIIFLPFTLKLGSFLWALPIIVGGITLVIGIDFCVRNFPHSYQPDKIPLRLLPSQS